MAKRQLDGRFARTHGGYSGGKNSQKRTRLYIIWMGMKQRCMNPKHVRYEHYGGRGITICQRWRDSFATFREDMGTPPTVNHTLDRIDPDGDYELGNCRWATWGVQNSNKSMTRSEDKQAYAISWKYRKWHEGKFGPEAA